MEQLTHPHPVFVNIHDENSRQMSLRWTDFLQKNNFDFRLLRQIDMAGALPVMTDVSGQKFSIDFTGNKKNYARKKAGIKTELLSKALGAGRYGLNVLDLSAGLGIDAVFLAQLGYSVRAVERNPLIYLALNEARLQSGDFALQVEFGRAQDFLNSVGRPVDVVYFDPMFPEKTKSALPRQEMVFFKTLVGSDDDGAEVLEAALRLKSVKRVVVKRPLKAPALAGPPPRSMLKGKLVRFDIYGVNA